MTCPWISFIFSYCDCFAAGIYCAEPCACQGCFNRPEYEDTVLETRQQIESRNPLAFAPKVVQHMTDSHSNIVGVLDPSGFYCIIVSFLKYLDVTRKCWLKLILQDTGVSFTPSSARHKRGCNCKRSMCLKKYCECYQVYLLLNLLFALLDFLVNLSRIFFPCLILQG